MARVRLRLTFANVISVLALFVALGGSATAAILITGKNVKNGSLTGADIKDDSVGGVDIKDGDLLAKDFAAGQLPTGAPGPKGETGEPGPKGDPGSQGPQGPQGSAGVKGDKGDRGLQGEQGLQGIQGIQGIQGEQGLQGLTGPSNAYAKTVASADVANTAVSVASLSLPTGAYVVQAAFWAHNNDGTGNAPLICTLNGHMTAIQLEANLTGNSSSQTGGDVTTATLGSPGDVSLFCYDNTGDPTKTVTLHEISLVAIKVGTLTTQ